MPDSNRIKEQAFFGEWEARWPPAAMSQSWLQGSTLFTYFSGKFRKHRVLKLLERTIKQRT